MNNQKFLILVLLLAGCSHPQGEIRGRIVQYGTVVFGRADRVEDPSVISGVRWRVRDAVFTTTTDRIPMKIGLCFGIHFEICNLHPKDEQDISLTIITKHPPITGPGGKTSHFEQRTGTRPVKDGRVLGIASYGFDHDYELVSGKWEFVVVYDGKTLCSNEFTVYQENP
jgi:Domain of unknown function (DUF3859)